MNTNAPKPLQLDLSQTDDSFAIGSLPGYVAQVIAVFRYTGSLTASMTDSQTGDVLDSQTNAGHSTLVYLIEDLSKTRYNVASVGGGNFTARVVVTFHRTTYNERA